MNTITAQPHIESFQGDSFFLFTFKGRMVTGAVLLSLAIIITGIFFYEVYAQVIPYQKEVSAVGGLPVASATSTASTPMREVHIANDGLILVRGARVVANSGNTVTISIIWGGVDFRWIVDIVDNTSFLTSSGEKATRVDIQPGDILTVVGMLTQGGSQPTIQASSVRG